MPPLGRPMMFDHRRILATAMSRLRGKLKYRPVIFELMPESFTLFDLQRVVEAILGSYLHKQNFRRLVENAGLVEPAGGDRCAHRRAARKGLPLQAQCIAGTACAGIPGESSQCGTHNLTGSGRCPVNTIDKNQRIIPRIERVNPFATFSRAAIFANNTPYQ